MGGMESRLFFPGGTVGRMQQFLALRPLPHAQGSLRFGCVMK